MQEVRQDHRCLGAPAVGKDGNEQAAADAGHGVDGNRPGRRGKGQSLLGGEEHDVPDDDGVAHAAEEVDEGQVPEGPGPAGVLQEDLAAQLGGRGVCRRRRRVVVGGSQGFHPAVGGFAVEEEQQGEQDHSAHGGDYPEADLPSGQGHQQRQGGGGNRCPHASDGLLDADGDAQLPLEPGGDGGGDVDGKEGLRQSQQQAVVDVKLPDLLHGAEEQHPDHVEGGRDKQGLARSVAVAHPSGDGR